MKMKLIKNIKYLQQNFHERYMYPKLQPILHRGTARVTSLLHVNSLWLCILCRFVIGAAGQKPIFMFLVKRKRKGSDSVLWQKPLHQQGKSDNTNNATKKFDNIAVADRLRTVSWSNYSHSTGVVNLVYGPNLPTPRNNRVIKRAHV